MGWSGAVYSRIHNWVTDKNAAVPITASRMDAEDDSIAAGIQECLRHNGGNPATANLPMGAFRHTGVGDASARTSYPSVAQIQDGSLNYVVDTGAANAIVLTLVPAITAYTAGELYAFVAVASNTTATTVNINGAGSQDVTKRGTTALVLGDIIINQVYLILYNGSEFELLNPSIAPPSLTTVNTFTKTQSWTKGADIVSAATLVLGTDGNYFDVTGATGPTTAITVAAGTLFIIQFDSTPTWNQSATLDIAGQANITWAAGDLAICYAIAANDVRVTPIRATGRAVVASGWNLIERVTASAQATVDFSTSIGAAHNMYMIKMSKVVPASDGQALNMQVSNDGGSTFEADAGDYKYQTIARNSASGSDSNESGSATLMGITEDAAGVGSTAGEGLSGNVYFDSPDVAGAKHMFQWETYYVDNSGNFTHAHGGGMYTTAEAIDGIRFLFASGNVASGIFELYGMSLV